MPREAGALAFEAEHCQNVPPTNVDVHNYPAKGLTVSLAITQLVHILKDSGSAKSLNKTFDFCGKLLGISIPNQSTKVGAPLRVGGHVC